MSRPCVTHHHACDCREAAYRHLEAENVRLRELTERLESAVAAALHEWRTGPPLRAAYDMAARLTQVSDKP